MADPALDLIELRFGDFQNIMNGRSNDVPRQTLHRLLGESGVNVPDLLRKSSMLLEQPSIRMDDVNETGTTVLQAAACSTLSPGDASLFDKFWEKEGIVEAMKTVDVDGLHPIQVASKGWPFNRQLLHSCIAALLGRTLESVRRLLVEVPLGGLPPDLMHQLCSRESVEDRYEKCMLVLETKEIRLDALDESGNTVLHAAVKLGFGLFVFDETETAELSKRKATAIFDLMCQPNRGFEEAMQVRDRNGLTPVDLALKHQNGIVASPFVSRFFPASGIDGTGGPVVTEKSLAIFLEAQFRFSRRYSRTWTENCIRNLTRRETSQYTWQRKTSKHRRC